VWGQPHFLAYIFIREHIARAACLNDKKPWLKRKLDNETDLISQEAHMQLIVRIDLISLVVVLLATPLVSYDTAKKQKSLL